MAIVGKINCPSCGRDALKIDVKNGCAECHECGFKIRPETAKEKYYSWDILSNQIK